MSGPGCTARRYNDQWLCCACALQWDVTDPEPPACLTTHDQHVSAMRELWVEEPPRSNIDEQCDIKSGARSR